MTILCCLCDTDLDNKFYLECTQCVNFNGDPFAYCFECADGRKASIAHQANRGEDHLFRRVAPPGRNYACNQCSGKLNGTVCYTCPTCPFHGGYDLCVKCGSPQSTSQSNRRHEHPLVPVTANGVISQSHLTYLAATGGNRKCDGCSAEPAKGFILSCNACGFTCNSCRKEGFNLCPKCADEERGTYLHSRWTPSKEAHTFTCHILPEESSCIIT